MKTILLRIAPLAVVVLSFVALTVGCEQSYGYRVVSTGENELTISDQAGLERQTHEVAPDAQITLDGQSAELQQLQPGDAVDVKTEQREGQEVATEITAKTKEALEAEQEAADPYGTDPDVPLESTPEEIPSDINPPTVVPEDPAPQPTEDPQGEDAAAEETVEGKIAAINPAEMELVVKAENGDEHTFVINDETKLTLDGEDAVLGDLKVDHLAKVSAKKVVDAFVAISIEATSE